MTSRAETRARTVDFRAGPPYSEETHPVEITLEQKAFGLETDRIYEGLFKRSTPWLVQKGRILYFRPVQVKPNEDPPVIQSENDVKRYGVITVDEISGEDLAREQISKDVAAVLRIFKRVEDNLPDFSRHATAAFRNVKGISRSYYQWGREETEHSNVAGLILLATGHSTQEELDDDYYKTQENTWEPPFETPIENLIYAMFQEGNTHGNYIALAKIMEEQGAVKCAYAIRQVASDEAFHRASYRRYVEAYARLHPQEAQEAALNVAWNFRMPALHLMRNRTRDTVRVVSTIGYNKEEVENLLRRGLKDLSSFVNQERAEEVVRGYWPAEMARLNETMRKPASAVPVSELESPPTQNRNGIAPA